jgi:signal transduction histidine kinase/ActR/RegA family two-component response regulator
MAILPASRLLAFARELQRVGTFEELLAATRAEVMASLGYSHAWLCVGDSEEPEEMRLLSVAGERRESAWEVAPVLKIKGDAMLEELVRGDEPVVVVDARTDPRTDKTIVKQMGNRTIINVPLRLLDKPFGAFGTGTFGDEEGCRAPTREELDYLVGMASQLSVAASRIRFLEERKQAERVLKRTEEQLRQSQKIEAVGRLAGGVAHDFNNLLSVILSCSHMVLQRLEPTDPTDPTRLDLNEIKRAAERAAELTRQLLAFSRQQVVEPRVLDINETLASIGAMIRRLVGEDIDLRVMPQAKLDRVKADPGQIEQVIMNLVVNARDAMPSGGTLTIETASTDLDETYAREHVGVSPGPHVMLAVSDTGTGMDKATQDRIFEPFFTTKEKGKGTGLGLPTVYGIVKQSGGSVCLYSQPGKGTTFKIYLPRTQEVDTPPVARPVETATLRGTETILLVEDEDQLRAVAQRILEKNGYRVLAAASAEEAKRQCANEKGPVHLLLTDVIMPAMSGRELADLLAPQRLEMKVLYMSGYTPDAIVQHGVLEPGLVLLQKPITPERLVRKVRMVLDAATSASGDRDR